ncbi:MAG: helix-turn-helix domain-containing protein [Parvularculaceae bacterium]
MQIDQVGEAHTHPISVRFERVLPLVESARSSGVDVEKLFDALNLPQRLLSGARNEFISLADYYRVQNRLSILIGDETLHLSSRQLLPGSTDFVLAHLQDCKTLQEVMSVVARSYNLLHGGQFNQVVKRRGSIDYLIDDRNFPYAGISNKEDIYFQCECILIFLHCMLMVISPSARDAITALQICRPSPGGDCGHLGYWDAPIRFGADVYRVSLDRDIALQPIRMPAPEALTVNAVYQMIVQTVAGKHAALASANATASRVRDALAAGVVEQADVATQMGVSVATLRRRLTEEGFKFRELREHVLNETAMRLLLEGRSVVDVSDALGFSEARAFNRAFKDWNGMTPKAFLRASENRPN